jgi:signal transduction histidine kinase
VLSEHTGLTGGVAAFVTALVLLPVQRLVARWVGRVVDRDRYVAVGEVQRFARDVRAGRRQPEAVEAVLRQVQGDPGLALHLARPDGGWVRLDGTPSAAPVGFAIEAGGDVVAVVVLGRDSTRARRRLADVAAAAWVPVEVARLRLVLREALQETEASRQRLAEASAAERRRLERELHDGAQQRVVATGMRLRLLQEQLSGAQAHEVDTAVEELRETVDELRRIAQGVRPALLGDGLAAALAAVKQASPIPFDLTVEPLPDVGDTRALTAYLVVNEAVANALKHADATRIAVTVGTEAERLAVQVSDDGVGLPEDTPLTALRDRIASVGGRLAVRTPPGGGTTIEALL